MIDVASIGLAALVVILTVMALLGALPAIVMTIQFLLVPIHALRNHYGKAAPYWPRVAVIVPAWNEGLVIGASIDRLMALDYPPGRLRVYVVDDASTDDTPEVVGAKERQYPGLVFHLRREVGGEGKAHTLNHGLRHVLADDWAEAVLIMDADVIYRRDSLRKMARHLADPEVGAVTAYIREGSQRKNALGRFIGLEYVMAQLGSRRAQNVLGVMACLAGGAQLHSRANIEALGGQIDTSSLAEDTVTTFETQLNGRKVLLEPHAVVLAEEPHRIAALWKQRLRWARGNVQLTRRYSSLWFRPWRQRHLGGLMFGLTWFAVFLLPAFMLAASIGLIGLSLLDQPYADVIFRSMWIVVGCGYAFSMIVAVLLDPGMGRTSWREAILFPGLISMVVFASSFFPGLFTETVPSIFGLRLSPAGLQAFELFVYSWISLCMLFGWLCMKLNQAGAPQWLVSLVLYLVGYGPILCAITLDAYIKEWQRADARWDKTEKTGRVMG